MNRQCPWLVTLIAYLLLNPLLLAHAGGVFSDASDKISFGDLTDQEMSAQFAVFEGDEFPPGTSAEDSSDSEDSSAEKRATLAMFVKRDGESCQIPMGAPDVPAASGGTPDVKADEGNVDDENKDCAQACTNAFTNCKGSSMTKPKRSSSATIPCKSAEYCFCGQTPTDDIASHCQWVSLVSYTD